jgi:DNA-binding Lrp family transcriptional regulator
MRLNQRDHCLLDLLSQDCRISNADLAEAVGMSASACWRRIRAFEEAGLITRYAAHVDPNKLGFGFHAIVHIQLTRHQPEHLTEFIAAVQQRNEVIACYATTGQADYHLEIRCPDIAAYNGFLEEFLFRLPAVQSAQTNVVLREVKCTNEPVPRT